MADEGGAAGAEMEAQREPVIFIARIEEEEDQTGAPVSVPAPRGRRFNRRRVALFAGLAAVAGGIYFYRRRAEKFSRDFKEALPGSQERAA